MTWNWLGAHIIKPQMREARMNNWEKRIKVAGVWATHAKQ